MVVPCPLSGRLSVTARVGVGVVVVAVAAAVWLAVPVAAEGDRGEFSDDDGAYYEVALDALARRGVLAGTQCAPGRICPGSPIRRSIMAVWLGGALTAAEPPAADVVRYIDVDAVDWRAPHIERLAVLGVTRGCATDPLRYCPDQPATRGQMAAFIARAFDLQDGTSAGLADTRGHLFEAEIDALAAAGVAGACAVSPLRYCPDRPATRGQMAIFVARVLGLALVSSEKVLLPVARLTGRLAPKSIAASGTGLYLAQNMMYQHTISVFDADKQLVKTVEDVVDLRAFGYDVPGESYRGAPVEAAFTSDGSHAFVSNYRMYGPGYDPRAGGDICGKDRGRRSFVYRIDAATLSVDGVYEAGPVPKFMAVTPDDRLLLVSNWCGCDVSVIDLRTRRTLAEVEVGRYPRGIAVTGDSAIAYVAVMGSTDIAVIDIAAVAAGVLRGPDAVESYAPHYLRDVGYEPRHLVLSLDGDVLYATLNGEGAVVALNPATGQELLRVRTGEQPRSMDISDDGTALYVVNYGSDTMTKLRAGDLGILQTLDTAPRPIGITYDSFNDEVWVSAYSGVIHVYAERQQAPPPCAPADCEVVLARCRPDPRARVRSGRRPPTPSHHQSPDVRLRGVPPRRRPLGGSHPPEGGKASGAGKRPGANSSSVRDEPRPGRVGHCHPQPQNAVISIGMPGCLD